MTKTRSREVAEAAEDTASFVEFSGEFPQDVVDAANKVAEAVREARRDCGFE
jgi:hypothetical protein